MKTKTKLKRKNNWKTKKINQNENHTALNAFVDSFFATIRKSVGLKWLIIRMPYRIMWNSVPACAY